MAEISNSTTTILNFSFFFIRYFVLTFHHSPIYFSVCLLAHLQCNCFSSIHPFIHSFIHFLGITVTNPPPPRAWPPKMRKPRGKQRRRVCNANIARRKKLEEEQKTANSILRKSNFFIVLFATFRKIVQSILHNSNVKVKQ